MTDRLIVPPAAVPWTPNRAGGVTAADGSLLGYSRWDTAAAVPQSQAVARYFAASPALADAVVQLSLCAELVAAAAGRGEELADALAELAAAQAAGRAAVTLLLDPMLRRDTAFNAPIDAVLRILPGGTP